MYLLTSGVVGYNYGIGEPFYVYTGEDPEMKILSKMFKFQKKGGETLTEEEMDLISTTPYSYMKMQDKKGVNWILYTQACMTYRLLQLLETQGFRDIKDEQVPIVVRQFIRSMPPDSTAVAITGSV